MTSDTSEKIRAVFLAALMALSVVAMTATFSGAVAAQNAPASSSQVNSITIANNDRTVMEANPNHTSTNDWRDITNNNNIVGPNGGDYVQQISINADVADDHDDDNDGIVTLIVDISESTAAGLQLDPAATTTSGVGSSDLTGGDDSMIEVRNAVGELAIQVDINSNAGTGLQEDINLHWVGSPSPGGVGSASVTHTAEFNGTTDTADYRAISDGATGIYEDDTSALLGTADEDLEATRNGDNSGAAGDTAGAYDIWQGQTLTLQTQSNTDRVHIYEYEVDSNGDIQRGSRVMRLGTAPGSATNVDTSNLNANSRYIVDFVDDNTNEIAVLDVDPLNLESSWSSTQDVEANEEVSVEVNSDDITGSSVSLQVFELDALQAGRFVEAFQYQHSATLDGDGKAEFTVTPENDFDGDGVDNYIAFVTHDESEVAAQTGVMQTVEPLDERVTIESPGQDSQFKRGDIVPINLNFQNTDTGTITFGDRAAGQSLEINVTVRDANGDGTATVYLNTFQIGHGYVYDENGDLTGSPLVYDDTTDTFNVVPSRNHGFFTLGTGSALVGEAGQTAVAHNGSLDLEGGPTFGGVLAALSYDLVSTAGEQPYKEPGVTVDDRSIVRLEERGTDGINVWTAPGTGEQELEVDSFDDIQQAQDDGRLTSADGTIANKDFLVLEMKSTGLTGLMAESVQRNNGGSVTAVGQFLDTSDNTDVTDEFEGTAILRGGDPVLDVDSTQTDDGPNVAPLVLDVLGQKTGVVANQDDTGNVEAFYIPMKLEAGTDVVLQPQRRALEPGMNFQTTFAIRPFGTLGSGQARNDLLIDIGVERDARGNLVATSNEVETVQWQFKDDTADVNRDGDVLNVPKEDNVEIGGTTNVAAGTNLTVNLVTTPGEEDPFFKPNSALVEYENGTQNSWSITEDFGGQAVGTSFEINIIRSGDAGTLTPSGNPVIGTVSAEPSVEEFVFKDQRSGGSSVVVDTFNTTQGGYIAIQDADGNRIGWSSFQGVGEQTNVAISLDSEVTENTELTAVAYRTQDRPYVDGSGNPITESAMVSVEDKAPAFFQVSDLDPKQAELDEPGDRVTVSATVTNTGDESANQTVKLVVSGTTLGSEEVSLDGGESTTVSFSPDTSVLNYGQTVVHTIQSADDDASGAVTVDQEPTPTPTPTDTPTATPTEEPTATATEEPTDTATATEGDGGDGDGAGFGVVVALLAFLGASLLAVRRQTRE